MYREREIFWREDGVYGDGCTRRGKIDQLQNREMAKNNNNGVQMEKEICATLGDRQGLAGKRD
jgi:hypothetical protein